MPKGLLELALALLGLAGISLLVFTNAYQRMVSNMAELQQLRQTTREQREQIDMLARQASEVQASLLELELLEQQVRGMLDLQPPAEADEAPETSQADRPTARVAQLSPSRGAARNRVAAARGGPAALPPDPINLGGLAALVTNETEATGAEEAGVAKHDFDHARADSVVLLNRMEVLRQQVADQLAFLAAKPSIWPAYGPLTSHFGARGNPFGWGTEFHAGVDIGAPYGAPVVATGDGTVIFSGWQDGYGRKVAIDHGYGFVTVYAHNSELLVDAGETVKRGDIIARVGSSGRSTAPHLHYEVWIGGHLTDPLPYLP